MNDMNISKGVLRLVAFLIGIIMGFAIVGWMKNREMKKEQQELRNKIAVLAGQDMLIRDTIRDTVEVVTQRVTTVEKIKEVLSKEDKALIKDLGMKVSELQSFQKMGTESRDTVYLTAAEPQPAGNATIEQGDSLPDGNAEGTDSVLRYRDAWLDFTYWPKSRKLVWESRDTFDIAVQTEYKHRFLWWKWGTKGYWTDLVSHNKRTKITYNRFVMKR